MNSSSLRRLVADHAALHNIILPPYYLHCAGSTIITDDLTQLNILLAGPNGTPYENGLWKLHLRIPIDYPKSPPKASFRTKIFHPNVEEATGAVCLDTLKRDWSSHLTLRDILITISCLLINPNPDSALNAAAGKLLQEDFDEFAKKAKLMTRIHACIPMDVRTKVAEALVRGEDKIDLDDETDYEDEASESKENDPSISPDPVVPPKPIQRNSVLGKRPLADLPTPIEPDEEDELRRASSERNIAANTTPNLSSTMSNLSFTGMIPSSSSGSSDDTSYHTMQQIQTPRRIARPHEANKSISSSRVFTFTGLSTSFNSEPQGPAYSHHHGLTPSSNKRLRVTEGKENADEDENDSSDSADSESRRKKCIKIDVASTPSAISSTVTGSMGMGMGLGLNLGNKLSSIAPVAVLSSATAQAIKARPKARIGIRRL